jgi:hypothetical protein
VDVPEPLLMSTEFNSVVGTDDTTAGATPRSAEDVVATALAHLDSRDPGPSVIDGGANRFAASTMRLLAADPDPDSPVTRPLSDTGIASSSFETPAEAGRCSPRGAAEIDDSSGPVGDGSAHGEDQDRVPKRHDVGPVHS